MNDSTIFTSYFTKWDSELKLKALFICLLAVNFPAHPNINDKPKTLILYFCLQTLNKFCISWMPEL